MPVVVNVHDAKTNLSRLLLRVEAGEDVVIARDGTPIARLVPYGPSAPDRIPGRYAGQMWISDDFDEPMPEDWLAAFEGSGDESPD